MKKACMTFYQHVINSRDVILWRLYINVILWHPYLALPFSVKLLSSALSAWPR